MESDQTAAGFVGGNPKKLLMRRKIEKNRVCTGFVSDDIYMTVMQNSTVMKKWRYSTDCSVPEGLLRCFYLVQNGHLSDSLIGEVRPPR